MFCGKNSATVREATYKDIMFTFPGNPKRKSNPFYDINQSRTTTPFPSHTQRCRSRSRGSRILRVNQSTRTGIFLFLCKVEVVGEREVKFVQAPCVQQGGLSHTRWRMKGQRWHSLAQEWKTFSAENREATTGRGSSGRPRVSMHHFGRIHLNHQN